MWTKLTEWYNRVALASAPREPEEVADEFEGSEPVFTFTRWSKTPRLFRPVVVTEKIDGTNAAVLVKELTEAVHVDESVIVIVMTDDGRFWAVGAQSRNRVITTAQDNQGFAKWVESNAESLVTDLGPGIHFGEFWGHKIGRGYGLPAGDRRFSLFNPATTPVQWTDRDVPDLTVDGKTWRTPGLGTVPVLYEGEFDTNAIGLVLDLLRDTGSAAAPGYTNPEGVIVYHTHAGRIIGKVTLDAQDAGKWETMPDA